MCFPKHDVITKTGPCIYDTVTTESSEIKHNIIIPRDRQ